MSDPTITEADKERFLAKCANAIAVEGPLETPCLRWANGISITGYGQFWLEYRNVPAHRMIWSIRRGVIPPNTHVLHRCDYRPCIELDHLFLGTAQDNVDDMRAKGRDSFGDNFGENNGQTILKEDQVLEIYELAWSGRYTQNEIGEMFGVSRGCVKSIKLEKTWKHLWRDRPPPVIELVKPRPEYRRF
jgi:hypothetical protein